MTRTEKYTLFALLLALLGVASARIHSYDIFWQLQSGRFILDTGTFIYRDTFSLAADVPRFEHCWLHDVLFYNAYSLLGYEGVSLLKGALVAATALALVGVARVRGSSWLAILCVAPTPVLLTFWAWKARPQLWSFLLFAVFLLILERHRRSPGRLVWALAPLMVVWCNLHGGAVLAFPIVLAYLASHLAARVGCKVRVPGTSRLFGLLALLLLATLATPYGLQPLQTLLEAPSLGVASGDVRQLFNIDWNPTTFAAYPKYFYALAASAGLLAVGWRRLAWSDLFLLAGLAFMGLKLERHTPFFLFGAAALLPVYGDAAWRQVGGRIPRRSAAVLRLTCVVAAVAAALHFGRLPLKQYGFFDIGLQAWQYPVAAADFVKEHDLPGNLFNSYGSGGYLMWALYPGYHVFWDGRQTDPEMFKEGLKVSRGQEGWQQILERHGVNTVVMEACSQADGRRYPLLDRLRESPQWHAVHAGVSHLVFVRDSAVDSDWLVRHRLPETDVDGTILSAAYNISRTSPLRRQAFWEMARIQMKQRRYTEAYRNLSIYLSVTPAGKRAPESESYYRVLANLVGG